MGFKKPKRTIYNEFNILAIIYIISGTFIIIIPIICGYYRVPDTYSHMSAIIYLYIGTSRLIWFKCLNMFTLDSLIWRYVI